MRSRGLLFSSVCVFAVLVSGQVLAQSFATAVAYGSGGNGPNAVAVADVSGDGIPDLVVANWCTDVNCTASSVGVLLGKGDGTFQPAVVYDSGGFYADAVAVADVDGLNGPDIIVGNCGFPKVTKCANGSVGVLLNNGNGTFQSVVPFALGGAGAASVAAADVNGDGKLDLLVATGSASGSFVGVLLGNGTGTFQAVVPYSTGGLTALSVAVADVNGDTKPDLVVGNWCTDSNCTANIVGVLLGIGDGTFQAVTTYGSGGLFANSVVVGDVNGDGKLDVIVGNGSTSPTVGSGNVSVLLGNGDGTFQAAVSYDRGGYGATSLTMMDMNGDGKSDLVVANCSTSAIGCVGTDGDVALLLGNGNGTFQTAVSYGSGGSTPFGVAVGDVNGDGKPDIVAANCVGNQCGAGPGALGVLVNTTVPDYTLSANPPSATVHPGSSANYVITLTPSNGYDGTVTITCQAGLPPGVTCNAPSIAPGQTQATLTVHTTGPSAALIGVPDVNSRQGASSLWESLGGVGLVGMILVGDWRKRNRRRMGIMLGILAVVMILALVGCGGSSNSGGGGGGGGGTPTGTYTLPVVGTGTAGTNQGSTASHPIPVTLVVN